MTGTFDHSEPMVPEPRVIAGFWRRIFAYMLDLLVPALPLAAFGALAPAQAMALGRWDLLIGFVAAFFYFSLAGSRVCGGRTLAQRQLGLKVVGRDGTALSLPRSAARAVVLIVPFFASGLTSDQFDMNPKFSMLVLMGVAAMLSIGVSFALLYLYVFNRRTRQSLHDLLTASFVVHADEAGTIPARTPRLHKIIAALILLLTFAAPFATQVAKPHLSRDMQTMMATAAALNTLPGVTGMQVIEQTSWTHDATGKSLNVSVQLDRKPDDVKAEQEKIAALVLKQPGLPKNEPLVVGVNYGFNFGIVHWTIGSSRVFGTAECQQIMRAAPTP